MERHHPPPGIRIGVRRDSLVSLLNANAAPDFEAARSLRLSFRPFADGGENHSLSACPGRAEEIRPAA